LLSDEAAEQPHLLREAAVKDFRDILVLGASAGGLEPLEALVSSLPSDLPAAVFVVMHLGNSSQLADVLGRNSQLPVAWAENGSSIRLGTVSIGPPGVHLLLHDGHTLLRRGPRENMARPAIDVLFRSAAASHGNRVIGIILSGALNDGVAGLHAIRRCGGLGIVQEPGEASVRDMPLGAINHGVSDYTARVCNMPKLITRLLSERPPPNPTVPLDVRLESAIAAQQLTDLEAPAKLGTLSPFTCPECHGSLWEIDDGAMLRFRCHVGHSYTAESMLAAQAEEIDKTLENLLRLRQERAILANRIVEKERLRNNHGLADQLERRARDYEEDARLMRLLLLGDETMASQSGGRVEGGSARHEENDH
jgi:two-component system chemotaxis response regulator CheB